MNLGSPDSPGVRDVRRYLNEFLMDERVIDIPYLSRLLLVKGIIAPFRAPRSAKAYRSVWTEEGSPLMVLTQQLKEALQSHVDEPVYVAMRYGNPSPDVAFRQIQKDHPDVQEVLLLPLYPHYAMSSYETAVVCAQEAHRKSEYPFRLSVIRPYYEEVQYIHALSGSIRPYLQQEYDHILFSYHGVPERHIRKRGREDAHRLEGGSCCDAASGAQEQCYRHQCLTTTKLVAEQLGLPREKFSHSFQSRLGKDEWLKPYTAARLAAMPAEGIRKLLVVCPAFVSDCLETLEEIAVEGKETFLNAGGDSFALIPCLNAQPQWIRAIAGWIRQYREGDAGMILSS